MYSTQGHTWDTYGRSNDFDERTWAVSGDGRNARSIPGSGVANVGKPVEGSMFDWLGNNDVYYDILGEVVGFPAVTSTVHPPVDAKYPGGPFQNILYDDDEKACHIAGRARVTCDFGSFVYATIPNDHTGGVSPSNPAPETFCAVNDDATGMAVDAIAHSPLWASSVIFITEDDPSQGGEHVDSHRTPIVIISPWVNHGYVSHTHFDVPSLHKLFAHILGKPYPNTLVAHAALPLDLFTSDARLHAVHVQAADLPALLRRGEHPGRESADEVVGLRRPRRAAGPRLSGHAAGCADSSRTT